MCVCVCVSACLRACVRACERASVRACVCFNGSVRFLVLVCHGSCMRNRELPRFLYGRPGVATVPVWETGCCLGTGREENSSNFPN